jgi:hypothetical protein
VGSQGVWCGSGMVVQNSSQRPAAQYTPDHYRRHRQLLAEKGAVKKPHADSTEENIWGDDEMVKVITSLLSTYRAEA